jgi:uncharacterized protein YcfL
MKKLSLLALVALFAISCNSASESANSDSTKVEMEINIKPSEPVKFDTLISANGDTVLNQIEK